MQEFLNYMFRNSHSKVQKLFNLLICETQLHKMIRYYTTLNHFGNAALVWKLVACPLNYRGWWWAWWWVGRGPLGPMCFMFYAQGPLSLCLPMCLVYFTERHRNTLFSIPMRQISLWINFDCQWSDPNCKVAHMLAQGVRVKVELVRSRHHRGSGCARPCPFVKRVFWQICRVAAATY